MSTNPNQNQQPDPSRPYGGYGGYNPSNPADDPYGANQPQPAVGGQQSDPSYVYGQGGQQYTTGQYQQQQQQQSNAYVPPSSVSRGSSGQSQGTIDARARRNALLSYLGLCFTGIVFFFIGRKNSFVRFHAAQSIVVFTPLIIVYGIVSALAKFISGIFIVGALVGSAFGCIAFLIGAAIFVLWVFLMFQAYRGVRFKLPVVGDYAEALMARFSRKGAGI
ncbi:DUF4870 domain-containing protein [Dictyobacter aurantiacus]|uniref:DUF4870 domain-containing protein n=1 Tax=Dictyobacter aurantiacus TaxID=1936993 RepID=A0A401ZGB1_9CHLR|nr:hypothetical protein [Dictyobacter aurantiacus]GCE05886.1 hypothetical protein KDAU_32150 [Dictyobacter aurantiacus]